MSSKHVSIWLAFDESCANTQLLRKVTQSVKPSFTPHITMLNLDTTESIEAILQRVRSFSKGQPQKAIQISLTAPEEGPTFHQSYFLKSDSKDLFELQKAAKEQLKEFTDALMFPHISVFYGEADARKEAMPTLNSLLSDIKGFTLGVVGLKVVDCSSKESSEWVSYGTVHFGSDVVYRDSLFINGAWCAAHNGKQLLVGNPAKRGAVFHSICSADEADVHKAVDAATEAFNQWRHTSVETRAGFLNAIADEIEKRLDLLVALEISDMGKPKPEAEMDMGDSAATFRYYAKLILGGALNGEVIDIGPNDVAIRVKKEPIGVAGLVIPWNFPFMMAAWKVAPCIATGSTCVLKPSEFTPLSALELAAICIDVGLPAGVVNVINGTGIDAGAPLTVHNKVHKIAFTGSVPTGGHIMKSAASTIKTVTLELGGKSPLIIFPENCDIAAAADWITTGIFFNMGQVCSATSRLIVHHSIKDKIIEAVANIATKIQLGDGFSGAKCGPVVNKIQYDKVCGYISKSVEEGCRLVCGGLPDTTKAPFDAGFYIPPTVFEVNVNNTIWKEEIFGPVLAVITFDTEEEALHLANDTNFGLAAAVITKDKVQAERVSDALRAGIVWVNCSQPTIIQAPWGGMKASGIGRELGPWGLNNYLEVKQICSWESTESTGWGWFVPSESS
jgi:betaine-aldehyde dehydrogenase